MYTPEQAIERIRVILDSTGIEYTDKLKIIRIQEVIKLIVEVL